MDSALTIVVPMAGRGSRFAEAGFTKPKPFIDILGRPMIERVLENFWVEGARFVLLVLKEHLPFLKKLELPYPHTVVPVETLTEGTACTVLLSEEVVDPKKPMLIANSDQLVDSSIKRYFEECLCRGWDGSIMVFVDPHRSPKWSFAKCDRKGLVTQVKEKEVISDYATVGLYLFREAGTFFQSAKEMIAADDRVNGEFYTCPVYNYAIRSGKEIGLHLIPFESMHGLGTPEDLSIYLESSACTPLFP